MNTLIALLLWFRFLDEQTRRPAAAPVKKCHHSRTRGDGHGCAWCMHCRLQLCGNPKPYPWVGA